jgi:RNA polymerase sigma factor (sigma-70 family)
MQEEFLNAYEKYHDELFRYALLRLRTRDDARDAVQETFCRAWSHIAKEGEVLHMRGFLYQILRRIVIDEYRKHTTLSLDALEEDGGEFVGAEPAPNTVAESELVGRAIATLSQDDQSVLALRFASGLEPKEMSEMLGISPNAVSVRIDRALKRVRTLLHLNVHSS